MTARTVVGTVVLPGGVVPTHATVMIELVASTTGRAIGWVPTADLGIAGRRVLECDTNGAWTVDLRPNSLISPSGTVYRLTYTASSDTQWSTTFTISVPDTSGTKRVEDILVDAPGSIATAGSQAYTDAALTAHVAAADPHGDRAAATAALQAHLDDATAAHAASAVSFTPAGSTAATDVQAAIVEVASDALAAVAAAAVYSPATRPWYLDAAWELFLGRPFSGSTFNTTTLAVAASAGASTVTLTNSAGTEAGEVYTIGTGNNAETVVVSTVVGNVITFAPQLRNAHTVGETCGQVWLNTAHPGTNGYAALGAFIANARSRPCSASVQLIPTIGPIRYDDDAALEYDDAVRTAYTDGTAVPTGWAIVRSDACTVTTTPWAASAFHPDARRGNAVAVTTTWPAPAGVCTVDAIPVRPGQTLTLTAAVKVTSGTAQLSVWNRTTGALVAGPAGANDANLSRKTTLTFVVPTGCTDLEVRALAASTAVAEFTVDDVRLVESRHPAPATDRYVIEDPGERPIVLLGDSWAALGGTAAATAINTRVGRTLTIINAGVGGNTLAQQLARFATEVAPHRPAYVVHLSCFMNDLTQNRPAADVEADIDTLIDSCRAIGAVPVILGPAPWQTNVAKSLEWAERTRYRCDLVTV